LIEIYNRGLVAAVAQLVEQRIRNAKVGSSTPPSGTSNTEAYSDVSLFFFDFLLLV
jgi:hypothetical protein